MTEIIKLEGVIIKKKDINDSDRLLTVFTTTFGKQSIIFKGINKSKRRDKTASDVFSHSKFVVYKKGENFIASSIDSINTFDNIKKDIEKINIGLYICSILNECLNFGERNSKIYDLSLKSFGYLSKEENLTKNYILLLFFIYKILIEEGVSFKVEEGSYFSIVNSILGEKKYEDSIFLTPREEKIVKKIYTGNVRELLCEELSSKDIFSVLKIFEKYFNYHLEGNLNLKKYIWEAE